MSLEGDCQCCTKHIPKPVNTIRVSFKNIEDIWLCSTTLDNLVYYYKVECKNGTVTPPGSVRKHFSEFVQVLAKKHPVL